MKKIILTAALMALASVGQCQTWRPLSSGGASRAKEISTSSTFPIPRSIFTKGGTLRGILVAGGQGGSASPSSCSDAVVQGGKGGDGGEVIEVDIDLLAGQCPEGLQISIGRGGRGGLRYGNGSINGEPGTDTQISCSGTVVATASGGGRRSAHLAAARAAKGGVGGAILNTVQSVNSATSDLMSVDTKPASSGEIGLYGYGSGGGGGGAQSVYTGYAVGQDGSSTKQPRIFHAPLGRGGSGAGNGGGPTSYASSSELIASENGSHFGAGGGGGAAICAGSGPTDAGSGLGGVTRLTWQD